jgi:hypothetical protein
MNDIVYIDHMKIADARRRHLRYANEQSTHHVPTMSQGQLFNHYNTR